MLKLQLSGLAGVSSSGEASGYSYPIILVSIFSVLVWLSSLRGSEQHCQNSSDYENSVCNTK